MSGIAGIFLFDGQPVEPGQVEAMTAAMHNRGPDGLNHMRKGNVVLGQCMLRTTPESLKETQPLTNEDESLVLVMDGRVDNFEELRRELMGKGVVLRTIADAELVLRAYEVWGEGCPDRIVGEYVFFIWDARKQRLFGARDAAGTRHFYYHQGNGWFAFASEIKGLLALPIKRRLNESRLLDYLVEEFDRDDEVGTFYEGILRLPAGHAMSITATGPRIWRWWKPGELTEQKFASLNECTEAFMDQLRVVVKCRLRSIKPVGAMLSGGLDSSSIVALISKEFRSDLKAPLQTISLVMEDRAECPDSRFVEQILQADSWLQPTIVTSAAVDALWRHHADSISAADEPFSVLNGLTYGLTYTAGRAAGCGVMFDGMAGDVLFYGLRRTARELTQRRRWAALPSLALAYRNHGADVAVSVYLAINGFLRGLVWESMPQAVRVAVGHVRDWRHLRRGDMALLHSGVAQPYLWAKRPSANLAGQLDRLDTDQQAHATNFTTGLISFGHEVYGPLALNQGIEPRSPFSDRRMIEFAIRMPVEAKLAIPSYKHILRAGTVGLLPDAVRSRRMIGGHPGWSYFDRLGRAFDAGTPVHELARLRPQLTQWLVDSQILKAAARSPVSMGEADSARCRFVRLRALVLARWLADGPLSWSP